MYDISETIQADVLHASNRWWLLPVAGVLWLVYAFIVLSFDASTVRAVALLFGFGFMFGGVAQLFIAFNLERYKWLHAILGVVSIVAAVTAVAWPDQTFILMAALVGWYTLFGGVFDIVLSLFTRRENDLWWLQLIVGVTQVLVGFWAVGDASHSMTLLIVWVGAAAMARGISNIVLGFSLRDAGDALRMEAARRPSPSVVA